MPGPFNTEHIAYLFRQRGYRVNEFAGLLDLSNNVVEAFLRGTVEPGDLRLSTIVNMAALLGIPVQTMFAPPAPLPHVPPVAVTPHHPQNPADPVQSAAASESGSSDRDGSPVEDRASVESDAAQLVACVYDNGRVTPVQVSELAQAFGWTLTRTYDAAKEADQRLRYAGLAMTTSHGELFVTPTADHLDARRALATRRTYERGLSHAHYKAAHQVFTGGEVTVSNSARQRLRTLGGLVNLGIFTDARDPAYTPEAREAFL
ncbi:helix-turn-helix domain-containing protein [Nocardioides abyssi]|uniref:Helix-turn-helix transcriptional regulator n=1 Tax=Nocardioides abyssi TaxID=3058370 RepID=A0ABT8ESJ7_9ACTN|nr:helix-turn-helix transcriptional regulator [Nocardioides abyssi]MDN4161131.1 helix-turn-helix transcriptional regulator [Nocardioides abyssi]